MSDQSGYNGWKNYETWAMALWIDNDEGSYNFARELRDEATDGIEDFSGREDLSGAVGRLADALKDWQDESMPQLEASVWSDLLNAAFGEVDWYEIADGMIEELVVPA